MSILIDGLVMPQDDEMLCINIYPDGKVSINLDLKCKRIATAVPVTPHGRLIDADALLLEWPEPTDWLNKEQVMRHYTWWRTILKTAPTIDAVPVVRCKDCKHRQELGLCPMYHLNYERYEWQLDDDCDDYTKDDGFCDRGEWGDDPSHPFADDVMMGD